MVGESEMNWERVEGTLLPEYLRVVQEAVGVGGGRTRQLSWVLPLSWRPFQSPLLRPAPSSW